MQRTGMLKVKRIARVSALGLLVSQLPLGAATASASTMLVPEEYGTLAEAVSAASSGDTVSIAPGTYTGAGNTAVSFAGKDLAVVGRSGAAETVIDCAGARGFLLENWESNACLIAGLTIRNGYTWYTTGGAAIRCVNSSPTIRDCVFENNTALSGGAIYVWYGTPVISNCAFYANVGGEGGGICFYYCSDPIVAGCTFAGNVSSDSAGIVGYWSTPHIEKCAFHNNGGGGDTVVDVRYATGGSIANCSFVRNYAVAIMTVSASPAISNSVIAYNRQCGVGIDCWGSPLPTVTHCVVWKNGVTDSLCGDHSDNLFSWPAICDWAAGDMTLCEESPCLPANNPWGEAVGALGQGCGSCATAVRRSTWGSIKALYRSR